MSETALQMLPGLMALASDDRAMLARELISSIDEDNQDEAREFEAMLDQRIKDMKMDPRNRVPADEVFRRLREKYP